MRFKLLILLLILYPLVGFAQQKDGFKLYEEETNDGFIMYADNLNPYPMSAQIKFALNNLKSEFDNNTVYVIPANSTKHKLTVLKKINSRAAYGMSSQVSYNYGNHLQKNYDTNFIYHLPFDSGQTFLLDQGYHGRESHFNDKALDFSMKVGNAVRAVRDGIVMEVVEKHNRHCPSNACIKYNNYVTIYQSDGTFCEYVHLKQNGATVEVGDTIKQGQLIGYSGNTGYTSGPHLHLMIYLQRLNTRESVATKFKVGNGDKATYLKEKVRYSRNY